MKTLSWEVRFQDCLAGLAELPDASVDLVFADYPFNSQDGRKNYHEFVEATANEFYRVLKDGGNLLVVNNPSNIFRHAQYFQKFILRQGIALVRKHCFFPAWHWGYSHNYALALVKGSTKAKWNGSRTHHQPFDKDVVEYRNGYFSRLGRHPQAMPYSLVERWIQYLSNEGDFVVVPFAGAGTEVLACARNQRRALAFDIKENFADLARRRVEQDLLKEAI